jgi:hypothetical protein
MVMNMMVFYFLEMINLHQGYAYQFSDFIEKNKIATKNLVFENQTKTCGGIEPLFYEELSSIATHVLNPTIPHTNPPQAIMLVNINLQFFKTIMFFYQIVVIFC